MGEIGGFLRHGRQGHASRPVAERVGDYGEILLMPDEACRRAQAGRCMDCGVGFCQTGIAFGGSRHVSGCPLHNHIPEWNDLAWRGLLARGLRAPLDDQPLPRDNRTRVSGAPARGPATSPWATRRPRSATTSWTSPSTPSRWGSSPRPPRAEAGARGIPQAWRSSLGGMPSEQHLTKGAASGSARGRGGLGAGGARLRLGARGARDATSSWSTARRAPEGCSRTGYPP